MSVNKVIILGRIGKDPEIRALPSGQSVINFSVATSEKWKDKESGEMQERTEWHNVAFFGPKAEVIEKYFTKGSEIYVEGRLQTRKWTDKEGNDRYTTSVVGEQFSFTGGSTKRDEDDSPAPSRRDASRAQPAAKPTQAAKPSPEDFDDDIPF
jgi:single-strand DNA-binding protein